MTNSWISTEQRKGFKALSLKLARSDSYLQKLFESDPYFRDLCTLYDGVLGISQKLETMSQISRQLRLMAEDIENQVEEMLSKDSQIDLH